MIKRGISRLGLLLGIAAVSTAFTAVSASAAPRWDIDVHPAPSIFKAGESGIPMIGVDLRNVGEDPSTGPISLTVTLPPELSTAFGVSGSANGVTVGGYGWECPTAGTPGESTITCTNSFPVPAGGWSSSTLDLALAVSPTAVDEVTVLFEVSGGGAGPAAIAKTIPVGDGEPPFGIPAGGLDADAYELGGDPERQAGAHPFFAEVGFDIAKRRFTGGFGATATAPAHYLRHVEARPPRGFVGNPQVVPACSIGRFTRGQCGPENVVGTLRLRTNADVNVGFTSYWSVFNVKPEPGDLAAFGFVISSQPTYIRAFLDPRDNSIVTKVRNISETLQTREQLLTLWGVPGDPRHDDRRCTAGEGVITWSSCSLPGAPKPFLSLPTECNVDGTTSVRVASWKDPNLLDPVFSPDPAAQLGGCDQLEFEPTIVSRPTTGTADSPSGLEFDLHIPQNEDPYGLATPHMRDATVTLPPGMTVNPPSADGLGACSIEQFGISPQGISDSVVLSNGTRAATPVNCPDASKLGTVEAISPALEDPVKGTVYLAEQNRNPFGSMLALYLALEDKERGLLIKLPGEVKADPQTGQLTTTFKQNPQLPVEDLKLRLPPGPRASLKTPSSCGVHETTSSLTPWSAPETAVATPSSSFELTQGPTGGACLPTGGASPNKPTFSAGTLDPTAKAFSPFVFKLARADGTQQLKAIETTLPKGLVAKLSGTTYCSDAALAAAASKSGKDERSSASCPASSRVGSVNVGAGAGSTPLYVSGEAYLAGPYKGAPLSLAIITPAVAGPFDLGTVVVRTALHVNPESAQVKAVSDELPQILQGIPLNIRSVAVKMDRPQFTLNPTSCDPMSINGSALSVFNQSAALTNPFQVGECNKLGFKPKLAIKLKGDTKRGGHPALTATVKTRPGDANIAKTIVALPHSEFLAQDHIRTICTRVQFAADACPQGSIYGTASAITPLLDEPLTGNVYLRSSSNPLPDMVIALRGKIDIDLVGRIDSDKRGGIRTSFETVPDAPVSSFTLKMAGGKKSLLENSKNLCRSVNKATAQMSAQNGMALESRPVVKSAGCKKARGGKARKGKK